MTNSVHGPETPAASGLDYDDDRRKMTIDDDDDEEPREERECAFQTQG